ncbi:MAG: hypothetical protein ACJ77N_09300 [Chloroflexota bacterium]
MAIFAGVFAFLGRQVTRILTTLLGWASTLLFGRVPADKQVVLVLITFGSIGWVALLLGTLVPDVGTVLLAFIPVPSFVPDWSVRLAMLIAAIVLPLVIGAATILLMPADRRPSGRAIIGQLLRGYPIAAFLALSLLILAAIAVWYKARAILHRASTAHVPMIAKPGGYDRVAADLERALDQADLAVSSRPAPAALALPARLLGRVAGKGIGSLVPDRLLQVRGQDVEVTIYPTDIAITGTKARLARARAAMTTRLTATAAYLTTSAEAQAIEDRLERLAKLPPAVAPGEPATLPGDAAHELVGIDRDLAVLEIPYDEWEVLYRMRLQVERDLLAGRRVGEAFPAENPAPAGATARPGDARPARTEPAWASILGVGSLVLITVDAVLALVDRLSRRDRADAS